MSIEYIFCQKRLVATPWWGDDGLNANQYEEWYIYSDFHHDSSESVNPALPVRSEILLVIYYLQYRILHIWIKSENSRVSPYKST